MSAQEKEIDLEAAIREDMKQYAAPHRHPRAEKALEYFAEHTGSIADICACNYYDEAEIGKLVKRIFSDAVDHGMDG